LSNTTVLANSPAPSSAKLISGRRFKRSKKHSSAGRIKFLYHNELRSMVKGDRTRGHLPCGACLKSTMMMTINRSPNARYRPQFPSSEPNYQNLRRRENRSIRRATLNLKHPHASRAPPPPPPNTKQPGFCSGQGTLQICLSPSPSFPLLSSWINLF